MSGRVGMRRGERGLRATFRAGGMTFRRLLAPTVLGSPVYECEASGLTWRVERYEPRPVRQWRAVAGAVRVDGATLDELAERLRAVESA